MKNDFSRTILLLGGALASEDGNLAEDVGFQSPTEDEADLRVEEAVVALVRGCLTGNCRLAMWNDPVLTPLVIVVALEYWESLPGEERHLDDQRRFSAAPVVLFGSESDEEEGKVLGYYDRIGCVQLLREFDPNETPIDRIVLIGGSDIDVSRLGTVRARSERRIPLYPISSTGGFARRSDESGYEPDDVVDLEGQIADRIAGRQSQAHFALPRPEPSRGPFEGEQRFSEPEREEAPQFQAALYPLIVSRILGEETDTRYRGRAAGAV